MTLLTIAVLMLMLRHAGSLYKSMATAKYPSEITGRGLYVLLFVGVFVALIFQIPTY